MSEVEKMYEKVGVKKLLYCDICKAQEHALGLCAETKCEPFYPPFTAGKQLELIKWLIKYDELHADSNDNEYGCATLNYSGKYKKCFDESLASVINNELWKDLTEQERTEIAEILRGVGK